MNNDNYRPPGIDDTFITDNETGLIAAISVSAVFLVLILPMMVALMAIMFWPVYKLIEFLY